MPRRTKDQAAETCKSILEAALDVFSRKGYSRTTFVNIADEIGLTKGAVYWHFKNKSDLLAAMINYEENKHYAQIKETNPSSIAELRKLLLDHLEMVSKNKDFQMFEFFSNFQIEWSVESLAEVHEKLNKLRGNPMKSFAQKLVHLQNIGELSQEADADKLSLTMFVTWTGALRLALLGECSFEQFYELVEQNFDMTIGQYLTSSKTKIYKQEKK